MGASTLTAHIYPSMFAIHNLPDQAALAHPQTGWISLPTRLRPSYIYMEPHGVYLIGK